MSPGFGIRANTTPPAMPVLPSSLGLASSFLASVCLWATEKGIAVPRGPQRNGPTWGLGRDPPSALILCSVARLNGH